MVVKNPSQPQIIPTAPGGATPRPGTGGTGMKAPTLRMFVFSHNQYKLRKNPLFFKYSYWHWDTSGFNLFISSEG